MFACLTNDGDAKRKLSLAAVAARGNDTTRNAGRLRGQVWLWLLKSAGDESWERAAF
jgi:hypothetical protein